MARFQGFKPSFCPDRNREGKSETAADPKKRRFFLTNGLGSCENPSPFARPAAYPFTYPTPVGVICQQKPNSGRIPGTEASLVPLLIARFPISGGLSGSRLGAFIPRLGVGGWADWLG